MEKLIQGSGGGGGGGSQTTTTTGTEYPDSLSSKSYIKAIDLLGEGEFEEVLVGGLQGMLLDDVPVQNSDGSYNFTGVSVETRPGTLSQARMNIGGTTESSENVGIELRYNLPIEQSVINVNADVVRVNVRVNALSQTNQSSGDVTGTSVSYKIEWKDSVSSVWNDAGTETISGKSSSEYERQTSFRISGTAPWIVRVTRLTADSTSSYLQNRTYFASITTVLEERLRYPGSVLVGATYDAEQFSSIPTRAFLCKCLKIKVPTNYDPTTRIYTGAWDGSFKVAWSDNPAWCFYDILTNTRYGLGERIPESSVDKWELYSIGQYCDELVPAYGNTTEPRFTCNIVIQTKEEAYKVVNDFASIFRGLSYWASGSIVPVQDRPRDVSYAFNNTNVADGVFNYQSSALNTRYNVACVTWNNPANFYKREVEYVEDHDLINSLGYINQTEVVAFGCASRSMARRVGRWLIYTNNYQTDMVSFTTGAEGAVPRPGDVVKISDTLRSQERRGGRVVSSTLAGCVLDNPLTFLAGTPYTFSAIDVDGGFAETTFVATGTTDTITFDSVLPKAIATDSIYIIADNNIEPQQFKIVSVTDKGEGQYEVTGLSHNPSKYAYIENDVPTIDFALPSGSNPPVVGIDYSEYLYTYGVSVRSRCDISWKAPNFAKRYVINVKKPDGVILTETTSETEYVLLDTTEGEHFVSITALNILNQQSQAFEQTIQLYGKTRTPQTVPNLALNAVSGHGYLTWDTHPDLDVVVGGFIVITHTPKTTGATWNDGVFVEKVPGASISTFVPLLGGTYMAKAIDSSGFYSNDAAFVSSDYAVLQAKNVVDILQESPAFTGAKTNLVKEGSSLTLTSALFIDAAGDIDSYSLFEYLGGGVSTTGEYLFSRIVDLGASYNVNISGSLSARSTEVFALLDTRTDLIDLWQYIDSFVADTFTAKTMVATTNDDPLGTPVWSDWSDFKISTYSGRAFKFKLFVETVSEAYNVYIDSLAISVDVNDRTVGENDVTCPIGGLNVAFSPSFMFTPAISIAINDMVEGDYYEISSKSADGFSVVVKNGGTPVERVIDYIAKGYGYKT